MKKRFKLTSIFLSFLLAFQVGFSNFFTCVIHADPPSKKFITLAYKDFRADSMDKLLTIEGTTEFINGSLRLSDNVGGSCGNAFYSKQISLSQKSFSTFFTFKMTPSDNGRADGIVFVLCSEINVFGNNGMGLGYQGIGNSIGIEFDTYYNGGYDPNNNHIGIDINGDIQSKIVNGLQNTDINLADGNEKYVWVDYDGTQLDVRISKTNFRPESALLSYPLSSNYIPDNVYAGFTASTGGESESHFIDSWYFNSKYEPIDTTKNDYIFTPSAIAVSAVPDKLESNKFNVTVNVTNVDGSYAPDIPITLSAACNGTLGSSNVITNDIGKAKTTFTVEKTHSAAGSIAASIDNINLKNSCTINYIGIPDIKDGTKSGIEDQTMIFESSDFAKNYIGDDIKSIKIESIPENGDFIYNKSAVIKGQDIDISNVNLLGFIPNKYWNGSTSFKWSAVSKYDQPSNIATETLSFSAVNHAPNAPGSITITPNSAAYKGSDVLTISWDKATDPDKDDLTYIVEFFNGTSWSEIYTGSSLTTTYALPKNISTQNALFRVKAVDPKNLVSAFTESKKFTIDNSVKANAALVQTGSLLNLGTLLALGALFLITGTGCLIKKKKSA